MNNDRSFNEVETWASPFATPMVEDAFQFVRTIVASGHCGGVIYAPTGTGKTSLIKLMEIEATSFLGHRENTVESIVISLSANERYVMSEGGFWGWLLYEFKHIKAKARIDPLQKRFLVYEYLKGVAATNPCGRVVAFIDEAQKLGLEELGLLADLLNELARGGFSFVAFLVGSYHLAHWNVDLQTRRYSHVRRRFFTKEHRFRGLSSVTDFQRCLRRFDVDLKPFKTSTITQYYHPQWYNEGGRLEPYAAEFHVAFSEALGAPIAFQVPMAFFCLALRSILYPLKLHIDKATLRSAVEDSGFKINYEDEYEQSDS